MEPHVDIIAEVTIKLLESKKTSNNLIPYLLDTIGQVSIKFRKAIIPYIHRVMPLMISCISD